MKYLCLVYQEDEKEDPKCPSACDANADEALAYREELRQSGHLIAASPLQPVQTATTIRVRGGQVSITDRPCAGTTQQLCAFYLIEARDLNDAIRVASKMPSAHLGFIEVRPLRELHPR